MKFIILLTIIIVIAFIMAFILNHFIVMRILNKKDNKFILDIISSRIFNYLNTGHIGIENCNINISIKNGKVHSVHVISKDEICKYVVNNNILISKLFINNWLLSIYSFIVCFSMFLIILIPIAAFIHSRF